MYLYKLNETMTKIGKLNAHILNDKARHGVFDVLKVYEDNGIFCNMQLAMDLYLLGYADASEVLNHADS